MFNLLSILLRYVFIIIIYLFIFSIIRLIYLDIRHINSLDLNAPVYLKLINRIDSLPYKMKEYYTIDKRITLGRQPDNEIYIKDPYVSKNHFIIAEDEGEYFIEDLHSANGTFINNERIEDVVSLENGDIIQIGKIEFLFVNKGYEKNEQI